MAAVDARNQTPREGSLYGYLVETVGREIVDGVVSTGSILLADGLCSRFGISRSVVREGIRTLSSMGLVEARPQVGTRVLPESRWDPLNTHIVRWRTQGPSYLDQMNELLELRLGVESVAAGLCAGGAETATVTEMCEQVGAMRAALRANDAASFFRADARFHRTLLSGTGNAMMARLSEIFEISVAERARDPRPGMHDMTDASLADHELLAERISSGDVSGAQACAAELVQRTIDEFKRVRAAVNLQASAPT